jgi:hypothetical protein
MDLRKRRLGVSISRATTTCLIGIGTVAWVGGSTSTHGAKTSIPPTVEVIQVERQGRSSRVSRHACGHPQERDCPEETGRSLDQTIAAKPTAQYDAKWGQFLITPAAFTGLVYMGV